MKGRERDGSGEGKRRRRSAEPLDWTHRCKLSPDRQELLDSLADTQHDRDLIDRLLIA